MPSMKNIYWQKSAVSADDRNRLLGHPSFCLWFTGLSGSGKSTIAVALEAFLHENRKLTYLLDGDNVRHGLNSNLGFSPEDRQENIRRVGEVAKLMVDAGVIVLCTFISPYRADRERLRGLFPAGAFIEVFVDTPLEICEERDVKGLYKKARNGEIDGFTGISAPYEAPGNPDIHLRTDERSVEESVRFIIDQLKNNPINCL